MTGGVHEVVLNGLCRLVVGPIVPADVFAGHLVAVALLVHHGEDQLAAGRDVVAEVVARGHVLGAPAREPGKCRVPVQRRETGAGAGLVRQREELLLGRGGKRVVSPTQGSTRQGQEPRARRDEREGEHEGQMGWGGGPGKDGGSHGVKQR